MRSPQPLNKGPFRKSNSVIISCRKLCTSLIKLSRFSIALVWISSILHVSANDTLSTSTDITTPPTPSDTIVRIDQQVIELWYIVSKYSIWAITVISTISLIILIHALFLMLTRYKRSNYFNFMVTMILLDLTMLTTIIFNLLISSVLTTFKGS